MNNNNSLKDYYVKLQELYSNVVNILTAINQSFHTSASEVTVNYTDTDNVSQSIRIPSFLYLESKIEQLDSNVEKIILYKFNRRNGRRTIKFYVRYG